MTHTIKCSISVPHSSGVDLCNSSKRRINAFVMNFSSITLHAESGDAMGLNRKKEHHIRKDIDSLFP